jgi:endonuclease/exonuclease/phosphatase family metal-dependent hydrolase
MGGGDKREVLNSLRPDIALYQELRRPQAAGGEACLWLTKPQPKSMAAMAQAPYTIEPIEAHRRFPRYFVPLRVSGAQNFQLISIWAMGDRPAWYVRGIHTAVDKWRREIRREPTVMMGDFNANSIWDHHHPRGNHFTALVERLAAMGLASAYHAFFDESHGRESRPTFYLYRKPDRPYHLDFCFIPREWLPRLRSVQVGTHGDWGAQSDHMPVVVDVDP